MKTIEVNEFYKILDERPENRVDIKFICPRCKHQQSFNDFIAAGVEAKQAAKYIGFSCIGRVDEKQGCDWTLGGLFHIHELKIIDDEGKEHPSFMPVFMVDETEKET